MRRLTLPQSNRQQKTRLIFIQALLRLLRQHDLTRITITDIANEANYGRWTFYQYFQSKEEVAYAAFVEWMNQLDAHIIASVQHLESPRREYESWRIIFRATWQHRAFFSRLTHISQTIWQARAKEFLVEQFLGHLRAGRFSLMDGVRPELAARLYVVSVMEVLSYWQDDTQIQDIEALVDEFFTFIFKQPPPKTP